MTNTTKATWDVLDYGTVPEDAVQVDYDCPNCERTAKLPVLGLAIAQIGHGGLVFDHGTGDVPKRIRCRRCRKTFERG